MTVESNATHSQGSDHQSSPKTSFAKIFGVGVAGWILGTLAVFIVAAVSVFADSIPSAFIWTMSHWWIGFILGLVLMVGYGMAKKAPVAKPLLAYVLPILVVFVVALICLAIYPDAAFRVEFNTYLPLVMMFHLLGLVWVSIFSGSDESPAFTRAVIPSLVGGLMILGFVAAPVFNSDAFRYRNAFKFTITKAALVNGEIHSEGTVEILKPGNFEFVAPRYSFAEYLSSGEGDTGLDVGTITWGAPGEPTTGKTGVFPIKIVWRKGVLPATFTTLPDYENEVFLDVCDLDEGGREIHFLSAVLKNQ
jgi:hypothetical protein